MPRQKQKNPKRLRVAEDESSIKRPTITWDRFLMRLQYHGFYYVDENGDMQWDNGIAEPGTPHRWPVRTLFK